jgi:hypothetical protein
MFQGTEGTQNSCKEKQWLVYQKENESLEAMESNAKFQKS